MNNHTLNFLRSHRLALLVFAALATLFLWDVLFLDYSLGAFDIILNQPSWKGEFPSGGIQQPILSDSPAAHFPQREFNWGHARQFTNVELNPYMFTGMPWSPQGVGAFITSFPQLFLDLSGAIDWATWLRLVCAGFFMYLLVVELGLGRMAGIFAGIVWTYSLHQVVWLEFPQHLATQLWIPLVYLFNLRLIRDGPGVAAVLGLLFVTVLFFTSGYMQIVLYTFISIGLFNTLYVLVHAGRGSFGRDCGRWLAVHAVFIAAVAVCAVGLYAEAQSISEGLRGAQDWRGTVAAPGLSLAALGGLLRDLLPHFSEVMQVLTPDYFGGIWEGRYGFENGNIVETGRYFGTLALLFACAALPAVWGTRRARMAVVFALVMALIFSMIYRNEFTISALRLIPLADKGSYSRYITLLTFFGALLAAYGLHGLLGARYRWLLAALALMGAWVLGASLQVDNFLFSKLWYPLLLLGVLGVAIVLRKRFEADWRWVGWLVVAVTAADLFAAGYGFNPRMHNERLFPRNNAIRYLLNDPQPYRVAVISDRPLYHPNILSYYDIPVVEGYLTVLPVAYAEYIKRLFPKAHITRNGILFILEPNVAALRLLNVKYVLSDKPLARQYPGLERVLDTNNHAIFRVRDSLPRVFCASDVLFAGARDDPLKLYKRALERYAEPLVVRGDGAHRQDRGRCRVSDLEVFTHGLAARIDTDAERYLVIPYAWNESWRVTVNGRAGELLKANGYHMALRLPAGRSRIELEYRNPWNQVSAWLLIVVALTALGFMWRPASGVGGTLRVALSVAATAMIFKSSLSLPMIRNAQIPERQALEQRLEVLRQGDSRTQREQLSERIEAGSPVTLPLGIESDGLTRLSLLAGTFHQARLAQTVTVALLDSSGEVLVTQRVAGREIGNNSWFTIRFAPIQGDRELRVRVSSDEPRRDRSFVLWLDAQGQVCVQSFYQRESD